MRFTGSCSSARSSSQDCRTRRRGFVWWPSQPSCSARSTSSAVSSSRTACSGCSNAGGPMSRSDAIGLAYLATIIAFILALRFLSSPRTAPLGNRIGAAGMLIAIGATFAQAGVHNDLSILIVMALAAPIGAYAARAVKMTAMPQMVALFNGVGGGAAALVALADFHNVAPDPGRVHADVGISIMLSALIGSVSFAGSLVAFGKLQELVSGRPIVYPGQKVVNL